MYVSIEERLNRVNALEKELQGAQAEVPVDSVSRIADILIRNSIARPGFPYQISEPEARMRAAEVIKVARGDAEIAEAFAKRYNI